MHVGGAAEWLLEPKTLAELAKAVSAARESGMPVRILGKGANLIVEDGTVPGVTIATDRLNLMWRPEAQLGGEALEALVSELGSGQMPEARLAPQARTDGLRLLALCGATHQRLVSTVQELGWSGLEGLVGVPGHVGGGVAMNAGGKWGEMWSVVEAIMVVAEDGCLRILRREQCAPTYRNGNLGTQVVAAALLKFQLDEVLAVKERTKTFLKEKNAVQPVTEWSAGCVFKNPDKTQSCGRTTGQLVDQAGLKGRCVGGAEISPKHGNFIVNKGHATATDVLELVRIAQETVFERFGVQLEMEAKVWRAAR
jgi:UDP-N-acetylmuramate dehydrogenase